MLTWVLRGCAIILSITLLFASWNGFAENRAFKDHGLQALAEPIDGYTETTRTRRQLGIKVDESKSNSAVIFFKTKDNERVKINRVVPDTILSRLLAGADVFIEYLPESPTKARFAGHAGKPAWLALFGLGVLGLTILFWRRM